ncbi:hypothetical protein [Clostridium paraputrificum]|uniref:Uncharacterized protein n=1 Tax=Clostridium paraputrificum TaxID=29363 RepID=A0A1B8RSX6_9CLOT|nr:hypothetical protein [Clostridium paraputrificum]OBY11919.1 hypothetical protein CP373A1_03065 [Clostridium paraputrificum]
MESKSYKDEMKELINKTGRKNFKDKNLMIVEDYYKRSEEDRVLLEKILKDFITDIDKVALLSLVVFTISPLIKALFNDNRLITIIVYLLLYVGSLKIITSFVKEYRFYNLYLDTINDIREKKIIVSKKLVEKIELQYDSKVE